MYITVTKVLFPRTIYIRALRVESNNNQCKNKKPQLCVYVKQNNILF